MFYELLKDIKYKHVRILLGIILYANSISQKLHKLKFIIGNKYGMFIKASSHEYNLKIFYFYRNVYNVHNVKSISKVIT